MSTYSGYSPVAISSRRFTGAAATVLAASGLLLVGSLLPWGKVGSVFGGAVALEGTHGDGTVTLFASLAAAAVVGSTLLVRGSGRIRATLALVIGLAASGIGLYDTLKAQLGTADRAGVTGSAGQIEIGLGLWLVDFAAVVLVLGAILMLRSRRRLRTDSGQPSDRWAPLTHPATSWAVPAQPYRTERPKLEDYSVPEQVRTMPDTDRMGG